MRTTRGPIVFLVALASLAVVSCSGSESTDDLGGDRLPVKVPTEDYGNTSATLDGIVTLEESGCWTIDLEDGSRLLVFPEGYSGGATTATMVSADGDIEIGDGATVHGVGGVVRAESFPGVPDGYWGNYLAFCAPPIREFVVFDEISSIAQ